MSLEIQEYISEILLLTTCRYDWWEGAASVPGRAGATVATGCDGSCSATEVTAARMGKQKLGSRVTFTAFTNDRHDRVRTPSRDINILSPLLTSASGL